LLLLLPFLGQHITLEGQNHTLRILSIRALVQMQHRLFYQFFKENTILAATKTVSLVKQWHASPLSISGCCNLVFKSHFLLIAGDGQYF
jgi:hypothetical protein